VNDCGIGHTPMKQVRNGCFSASTAAIDSQNPGTVISDGFNINNQIDKVTNRQNSPRSS